MKNYLLLICAFILIPACWSSLHDIIKHKEYSYISKFLVLFLTVLNVFAVLYIRRRKNSINLYKSQIIIISVLFLQAFAFSQETKPVLSITIDDPSVDSVLTNDWRFKDDAILNTLDKHSIKAALFVCGKRTDNNPGRELLAKWDSKNHLICNHSYSHLYFHSGKVTLSDFENDFRKCDAVINSYSNFTKLFRYPYLKEGNTDEKRDGFRNFMAELNYKPGYVSIDASDWYFNKRLTDTLSVNSEADITPYKEYYLKHILSRAVFYNDLAKELTGRFVPHTLLLHHNLINALFLDDLLIMFKEAGWDIVNADIAFKDEIYNYFPDILPAGESLIWALAKQSGKYDRVLRYPGEDSEYEENDFNLYLNALKNK